MSSEIFQVLRTSTEINLMEMEAYREKFLASQKQNELLGQEIVNLSNQKNQLLKKNQWYHLEIKSLSVKALDLAKKYFSQEDEKKSLQETIASQNSQIDNMKLEINQLKNKCEALFEENKLWQARIQTNQQSMSEDEENRESFMQSSHKTTVQSRNSEEKYMKPSIILEEIYKQVHQQNSKEKSFRYQVLPKENIHSKTVEEQKLSLPELQPKKSRQAIETSSQVLMYIEEYLMNIAVKTQERAKGSPHEVAQKVRREIEKKKKKIRDYLDQFNIKCQENQNGFIWGFWSKLFGSRN